MPFYDMNQRYSGYVDGDLIFNSKDEQVGEYRGDNIFNSVGHIVGTIYPDGPNRGSVAFGWTKGSGGWKDGSTIYCNTLPIGTASSLKEAGAFLCVFLPGYPRETRYFWRV